MNIMDLTPKQIYCRYYKSVRKELGQNFIFDENVNREIVSAANLDNKIVVEVGPGPGGLTLEILRRNVRKLYIVEYDNHWCEVWRDLQQYSQGKLELIQCDALKFDLLSVKAQVVISNLPYNISTKLLTQWFPIFHALEELVLMFQKEVADRIIAIPKTKEYGQLSVTSQWLSNVSKVCDLSPEIFSPPPKVYSSVLKFIPYRNIEFIEKYTDFVDFVGRAFAQRRKIVKKNIDAKFMQKLYEKGYLPNSRAEEISVQDYIDLISLL